MNYKILMTLTFLCFSFSLFADPWDCMSKEDAETLKTFLEKEAYVIEYCDCCDNSEAHLVLIKKMKIIPCHWDETQYSVAVVSYEITARGFVDKNGFQQVTETADELPEVNLKLYGNAEYYTPTLNYTFTRQNGKAVHLNTQTGDDRSDKVGCDGLKAFPDPRKLKKIKGCKNYKKFYRRNK